MRVSSADLGQLVFLAEGGFAKVFRAQEFVLPGDETPLAYKQFTLDRAEQARSAAAAVAFRVGLSPSDRAELDQFCAWPRALVEDESGELCGLLMPLIPEEFFCRYEDPTSGQITAMPREMSWLVASEAQRNASMIDLADVDHPERLTLLAQLAYIIAWLHEHGWVFGDISFKNAVFAVGPPRMMLLDCDGAAALTDFDRRQISTPMWDPPECHIGPASNQLFSVAVSAFSRRAGPRSWRAGPRSEQTLQDTITDVYKLGLAILRCLTPGKGAVSSRTVGRLAGELDAEGTDLVTRALSAYRASRPTARELYTYLYGVLSPSDQAVLPRIDALRRPVRPLAGVRSDAPSPEDLLGAAADAEMLADLIAAAETAAPLAIALIGDWGSGKSSVMLQIQRRIDVLAEMSRNDPGRSMFAANVRQVRFNAWDYSEDQVWSGLVEHLFRALATEPAILATPGDHAAAHAERASLAKQLADREAEERRLVGELTAADEVARPRGYLAGLSSPAWVVRVIATAIGEVGRDVRENVKILLGWAVLGAAAAGAWFLWGSLTGATAAALAAMLSPAIVVGRRLRSWHRAGVDFVGAQRRRLDARQRTLRREIAQLKERLALADAATRLSAFLADRAGPDAYRQYRSLLGQVRGDLRQLSDDLNQVRREWLADGAAGAPPLERIVLYIDDLDRCPPQKVVEVLEAIHLMLALELFVVVVAVDARWLTRSLEHHYRELFSHPADTVTSSSRLDVNGGMASPADYLDKIFQIPYALTPPPPAALASYLRSLLPLPVSRASAPQPMMEGTASAQANPEELSGSSPSQDALRALPPG